MVRYGKTLSTEEAIEAESGNAIFNKIFCFTYYCICSKSNCIIVTSTPVAPNNCITESKINVF